MLRILDHGYVKLIEHWGSDERIIEAARMSVDKGFQGWEPTRICKYCRRTAEDLGPVGMWQHCPNNENGLSLHEMEETKGDAGLLRFLWKHRHTTPFEMAGAQIEVKAPIFVFREWHRHRTQSYNEMSARYTPLPNENYIPTKIRCSMGGGSNKQAAGVAPFDELKMRAWRDRMPEIDRILEEYYQEGLAAGVPKEVARIRLPVGRYSRMRAQAVLKNWLDFLNLRQDADAQWEIRQFADAVAAILAELFPRTLTLFQEGRTK